MIRLLAISGSLRAISTNTTLLKAARMLAPEGVRIELYDGLAGLPHFNPDLDVEPPPPAVAAWREAVRAADGLLISSPEYARGVPGSLKNAFDWLVSSDAFPAKPVAFFHASDRGTVSRAALRLILETMAARIVDEAEITLPLLGRQTSVADVAANAEFVAIIGTALAAFARSVAVEPV